MMTLLESMEVRNGREEGESDERRPGQILEWPRTGMIFMTLPVQTSMKTTRIVMSGSWTSANGRTGSMPTEGLDNAVVIRTAMLKAANLQ